MPDATPDWEASERVAQTAACTKYEEGQPHLDQDGYSSFSDGWNAAIDWVKRTAILRMLGGRPPEDHCDHQHQETNANTGRMYCLECNTTIAVLTRKRKHKRSPHRRRSLARQRDCPTCGAGPSDPCKDLRNRNGQLTMLGVHEARRDAKPDNPNVDAEFKPCGCHSGAAYRDCCGKDDYCG